MKTPQRIVVTTAATQLMIETRALREEIRRGARDATDAGLSDQASDLVRLVEVVHGMLYGLKLQLDTRDETRKPRVRVTVDISRLRDGLNKAAASVAKASRKLKGCRQ